MSGRGPTHEAVGGQGALGIAILGSIGVAIYRARVDDAIPGDIPPEAATAAGDTLGAAVAAAQQLDGSAAAVLLELTRGAFVSGMQLSAAIAAVIALAVAVVALFGLRKGGLADDEASGDPAAPSASEVDVRSR